MYVIVYIYCDQVLLVGIVRSRYFRTQNYNYYKVLQIIKICKETIAVFLRYYIYSITLYIILIELYLEIYLTNPQPCLVSLLDTRWR